MTDPRAKYVSPSISETAFNCPHCGALASQSWFETYALPIDKDRVPRRIDPGTLDRWQFDQIEDRDKREEYIELARKISLGRPFFSRQQTYINNQIENVSTSRCYNCDELSVWIHNRLAWPSVGTAALPNVDLPAEVRLDYEEASTILGLSPRGAAALLRLAIQKLCVDLGGEGKNLDNDIATLVSKGLDVRVQQALDVVRVIGNNAVHPGQIDLRDDLVTAEKLFGLVNLIADIMITQPNHLASMFGNLPSGSLEAIERRNARSLPMRTE